MSFDESDRKLMDTTSSRLLTYLHSSPEGSEESFLSAAARAGIADYLEEIATGTHLFLRNDENNIGALLGSRDQLSPTLDAFWSRHFLRRVPEIVDRVLQMNDLRT